MISPRSLAELPRPKKCSGRASAASALLCAQHGAAQLHSHIAQRAHPPREGQPRLLFDPRTCRLTILAICTSSLHGLVASHPSRFAASPVLAVRASNLVAQAAAPAASLALPPAGYEGAVAAGTKKAGMAPNKIFALGMISGAHIGFGAWLMLAVGGACPGLAATNPGLQNIVKGAFGLPFGLMMTLVTGAELFTGNTALVTAAVLEKKATLKQRIGSCMSSRGSQRAAPAPHLCPWPPGPLACPSLACPSSRTERPRHGGHPPGSSNRGPCLGRATS